MKRRYCEVDPKMQTSRPILGGTFFILLFLKGFTLGGTSPNLVPIWQQDLRTVGWGHVKPQHSVAHDFTAGLLFLDNDDLVASFVTGEFRHGKQMELHLALLQGDTGKLKQTTAIPVTSLSARLANNGSGIFVYTDTTLFTFSSDLVQEKSAELLAPATALAYPRKVLISPSGKTAMVLDGKAKFQRIFNTSSLELTRSCEYQWSEAPSSISDRLAAHLQFRSRTLAIQEFCVPPESFETGYGEPRFLDENKLIAFSDGDSVLLSAKGIRIAELAMPKRWWYGQPGWMSARNAGRFAIVGFKLGGIEIPSLDIYHHAVEVQVNVYEGSFNQVFSWRSKRVTGVCSALSNSGVRLAVIDDGVVRVFQLPAASTLNHTN